MLYHIVLSLGTIHAKKFGHMCLVGISCRKRVLLDRAGSAHRETGRSLLRRKAPIAARKIFQTGHSIMVWKMRKHVRTVKRYQGRVKLVKAYILRITSVSNFTDV